MSGHNDSQKEAADSIRGNTVYMLRERWSETPFSFSKSRTEHDMETKLTSLDFSHRGAEDFAISWLQVLGNRPIYGSLNFRYTNRKRSCCINLI